MGVESTRPISSRAFGANILNTKSQTGNILDISKICKEIAKKMQHKLQLTKYINNK